MTQRDNVLITYAKASGAFQYAADRFLQTKDNKYLIEAQNCINNLINRELPIVMNYCKQHADEDGIESLSAIVKADCKSMHAIFKNL